MTSCNDELKNANRRCTHNVAGKKCGRSASLTTSPYGIWCSYIVILTTHIVCAWHRYCVRLPRPASWCGANDGLGTSNHYQIYIRDSSLQYGTCSQDFSNIIPNRGITIRARGIGVHTTRTPPKSSGKPPGMTFGKFWWCVGGHSIPHGVRVRAWR